MNKTVNQKISAASRLRGIASLLGLSLCLSSCLPTAEAPQPFPDLVFYQGAKRFSFGAEPERWLTDVPDGHGGRAKILSIEDDFYTSRGFLLYICSLEGEPGAHFLYEYDYGRADSEFVCELSPRRDPRFFDLDNDYSPGFYVMGDDGDSDYAFLGEGGEVVSWEGEDYPHYACKWGYATSLLTPWNGAEFVYDLEKPRENTFHFFDGTEVAIENGGRVVSAGEDKVLILGSDYDNRLSQYDKATGKMTRFEGDYSYPRGRVFVDRFISSSSHGTNSHFLWKHDYETKQITLVSFADGNFQEHVFSYGPNRYSGVDYCYWIVSTDMFLVMAERSCLRIDLALGTVEELPTTSAAIVTGHVDILPFDRTIYKNERYELIERYMPRFSIGPQAAYYVRYCDSLTLVLLQKYSSSLLFYQVAEEIS